MIYDYMKLVCILRSTIAFVNIFTLYLSLMTSSEINELQ
jgi:hypothetical protein